MRSMHSRRILLITCGILSKHHIRSILSTHSMPHLYTTPSMSSVLSMPISLYSMYLTRLGSVECLIIIYAPIPYKSSSKPSRLTCLPLACPMPVAPSIQAVGSPRSPTPKHIAKR